MRLFALISALGAAALVPPVAAAATADYLLQVGVTHFYGNLAVDPHAPTLGLAARRVSAPVNTLFGPVSSYWEVALQGTHTVVEHASAFPFHAEAPVSFLNIEFSANECFLAASPLHPCLGVGANEMTVDGADNEQNYGAPAFKLELQYAADASGLIADAVVQYSLVPQTVEKKVTDFSTVSYLLGIGWRFGAG